MEIIKSIFQIIFYLIVFPAFLGLIWMLVLGTPCVLVMAIFKLIDLTILDPIFKFLNAIPLIGFILKFGLACIIGFTAIIVILVFFQIPYIYLTCVALGL